MKPVDWIRRVLYHGPPLAVLHENYAKQRRTDDRAPITTSTTIAIAAPVDRVWSLLIDLAAWPKIDPSYRNIQLESTVTVDAHFRFVLNNFPIRARFAIVDPHRELTWTGLSLWFKAVDIHRLQPAPDSTTRLTMAESLSGLLAHLFLNSAQLKAQHDKFLAGFKRLAETKP
jgi:hypothetical protein